MSTVFWDFDGTLAYSVHLWSGSMYRAIKAVDPQSPVTFLQIRECNTRGFTWQTPDRDHTAYTNDAWWLYFEAHAYTSYLSCGASDEVASSACALVRHFILNPNEYLLYDDTISTLQTVKRMGHHNILLSNNYPELETIVSKLGLLPYFDGLIVSAIEGYDKPRRELFDIAKKRHPDTQYYMVGDNPYADIKGGKQANMTTVLVHSTASTDADHHITSLCDILPILNGTIVK